MILPEDMQHVAPRFAAAGLTAKLVETTEPDVEDDQIEIFCGDVDTCVTIQISNIGGGYYVNEYRGEDATRVLIPRGEFRKLREAVDCAIKTVKAEQSQSIVKVGQVWQDCDKRMHNRKLRVVKIAGLHAHCANETERSGRLRTKIRLDRFKKGSTGFVLVQEAPP